MLKSKVKMKSNKLFQIELCYEDAQRIISAMEDYKEKCNQVIQQCDTDMCKEAAWLEWSYVSELAYILEDKFDVDLW
jgi:hypothetical protein